MNMHLREYQQECIDSIIHAGTGAWLAVMATGLGKTVTFANLPRAGRTLILSHRRELVTQPRKYFDCDYGIELGTQHSHGEPVVSASVQTMAHRMDKFRPDDFERIICDECFPAGTLVDEKPIEQIKVGDYVNSYNENAKKVELKKVTHIFKVPLHQDLIVINKNLICTENHPIYDAIRKEYKYAKEFKSGDSLLHYVQERNSMGCTHEKSKGPFPQIRKGILFVKMFKRIFKTYFVNNDVKYKQKICVGKNESAQPYEKCKHQKKSIEYSQKDWISSNKNMWKWKRSNGATANAFQWFNQLFTCYGIFSKNKMFNKRNISSHLQNRYCTSSVFDCNRSRRWKSSLSFKKGRRCKENGILELSRVDSVKILEQRSAREQGKVCADGYVYNLAVEKNNNYFANGYLVHNCHHSGAKTYHDIFNYFQPRQLIGFTATPNRSDSVRLDDVFQDIVFERDLKWGIKNGYLSDIYCQRVNIGYDLSHVKTSGGDYAPGELEEAMDGSADAIAQAYKDLAVGATLIFAVSVKQSEEIAKRIPGAAVVSGKTPPKERQALINGLADGSIPCLVNCMVFTEGTDIPRVETVIIARPTKSDALYTQMVGRGLRLAPGKDKLNLIDCVGVTGSRNLCTAPSLLGIDLSPVPEKKQQELEGLLFDLPDKATTLSDCPESWIRNVEIVDLWAKTQSYNTHGVNWFKQPDGRMTLSLPHKRLTIPPADKLGRCNFGGRIVTMQYAFDNAYKMLCRDYAEEKYIWDVSAAKRWGVQPASEKQIRLVNRMCKDFDCTELTKLEANQILNRRLSG